MGTLIAESPALVAIGLGVLGLGFMYGFLQTGNKLLLGIGMVLLILIPIEFVVADHWVTDREALREVIRTTATAVETNDFETAVAVIGNQAVRQRALQELSRFRFREARVTGERKIEAEEISGLKTAETDLNVMVDVSGGGVGSIRAPRRLILQWEHRGGKWIVTDYRHTAVVGPDRP